jgi:diguanylate cyclase (GGDEF)-like protein
VGFLITSLVSYFVALNELRNNILEQDLPLSVDNIYYDMREELHRPIFISSLMASDTFLRDWVMEGENEPERMVRFLENIKVKYNTLTSFFISDKSHIYYDPSGKKSLLNQSGKVDAWYFRVKNLNEDYEVNIDVDYRNSKLLTVFINHKVEDFNGEFIGVAGVGLEVDVAKAFIDDSSHRFKHHIYFLDRTGDVKLSSSNSNKNITNIRQFLPMKDLAEDILSGEKGIYEYQYHGHTHYVTARHVDDFNWIILVEKSDKDSKESMFNALAINILICIVIIVVVVSSTNFTIGFYQRELEVMAHEDKLTGVYNRHAFDMLLKETLQLDEREQTVSSIVLFDIDYFKKINDQHGHLVGDEILVMVAKKIKASLRKVDVICRWGGEEFLVLLKHTSSEQAIVVAEQVREQVAKCQYKMAKQTISVTISGGVSSFQPYDTAQSMLSRADKALYDSKNSGRNRVTILG